MPSVYYTFDDNKIYKSKAIDDNGYHKDDVLSGNDESDNDEVDNGISFYITANTQSDNIQAVVIINEDVVGKSFDMYRAKFRCYWGDEEPASEEMLHPNAMYNGNPQDDQYIHNWYIDANGSNVDQYNQRYRIYSYQFVLLTSLNDTEPDSDGFYTMTVITYSNDVEWGRKTIKYAKSFS